MGEIFTDTYPNILHSAKLITRRRNIKKAPDLINTTYIYLSKYEYPTDPIQFTKRFVSVMKLLYDKPESAFNKLAYSTALSVDFDIKDQSEEINQIIEDIELPTNLSSNRVLQFISLVKFKKTLPLHEQYIFDLHYFGNTSCNEIARQLNTEGYNIHRVSINKMVQSIRTKLNKWKQLNL